MKAILIARVSDKEQRKALPAQKLRLHDYAREQKMESTYYEFDESAFKDDRKKFEGLVQNLGKSDGCEALVFDKIDRFTRDSSQRVVSTVKKMIFDGKLELHFPHDHITLKRDSAAVEWFQLDMGMSLAGYYSASVRDNVKRRFDQMINEKTWIGAAPLGYLNVQEEFMGKKIKDIIVDQHRAPFIVKIFEMRAQGTPYGVIASEMNKLGLRSRTGKLMSKSFIEKVTRNTFYYGVMSYKGNLYDHKYEPLIKHQLFNQCQEVREKRRNHKTQWNSLEHTFDDIVTCKKCGGSVSTYVSRGNMYMKCSKCSGNTAQKLVMPTVQKAVSGAIMRVDAIPLVIEKLKTRHDDQRTFFETSINETKLAHEKNLERKKRLMYEKVDGNIDINDFNIMMSDINNKQNELESKLDSLTNDDQRVEVTSSYLLDLAQRASDLFNSSNERLQQKLLKVILSNIQLSDKKLSFEYSDSFQAILDLKKMTLDGSDHKNWCG